MAAHNFSPSIWEAEVGGFCDIKASLVYIPSSRAASQVSIPNLRAARAEYSETLSQKLKKIKECKNQCHLIQNNVNTCV